MSSTAGLNPNLDERMLITVIQESAFMQALQALPLHYKALAWLRDYVIVKSVEGGKFVRTNDRLLPAGASGEAQAEGSYGSMDVAVTTIKQAIKYTFSDKEASDLTLSGAMGQILANIRENNVEWFYDLVGKLFQGIKDGIISYLDEDGNLVGQEDVLGLEGERLVLTAPRSSASLWYQNIDGVMTDVAPNYDTLPISLSAIRSGHITLTSVHRRPSVDGKKTSLINPRSFGVMVHPSYEIAVREALAPADYPNSSGNVETSRVLPMYDVILVNFPNPKMWVQITEKANLGIVHYAGKLTYPRNWIPKARFLEPGQESGGVIKMIEAELGLAGIEATGFIMHEFA